MTGSLIRLCPDDVAYDDLFGRIEGISKDDKNCLIALASPNQINDVEYQHIVAKVRKSSDTMNHLSSKGYVTVGAFWIPAHKLEDARRFDVSWWRGGKASLATLFQSCKGQLL